MPPYGALVALSAPWVALRCGVDAAMRAGGAPIGRGGRRKAWTWAQSAPTSGHQPGLAGTPGGARSGGCEFVVNVVKVVKSTYTRGVGPGRLGCPGMMSWDGQWWVEGRQLSDCGCAFHLLLEWLLALGKIFRPAVKLVP